MRSAKYPRLNPRLRESLNHVYGRLPYVSYRKVRKATAQTDTDITNFPIKEITAVLGIYAYFAGWVYTYFYYKSFDVSLISLDLPFYYMFVYSFPPLYSLMTLVVIMIFIVGVSLTYKRRPAMFLLFLLLFIYIFDAAKSKGQQVAHDTRYLDDNHRVRISFNGNNALILPKEVIRNNEANNLRLLVETKDQIVVYSQPGDSDFMVVYQVPRSEIEALIKLVR